MADHKWLALFLVHTEVTPKTKDNNEQEEENNDNDFFYKIVMKDLRHAHPGEEIKIVLVNTVFDKRYIPARYTIYVNTLKNEWFSLDKDIMQLSFTNGFEMQNREKLTGLFNELKKKYPSDKVMIFTYGHGSVFGIFTYDPDTIVSHYYRVPGRSIQTFNEAVLPNLFYDLEHKKTNKEFKKYEHKLRFTETEKLLTLFDQPDSLFQEIIKANTASPVAEINPAVASPLNPPGVQPEDSFKIISNEDLAYAIRNSFKKVDFIVLNNCVMQNVYSQFALQTVTDYLIAPQTGVTNPGLNMRQIIKIIKNADDRDTNDSIAKKIIEGFANMEGRSATETDFLDLYVVLALKLGDSYNAYITILKDLAEVFTRKINEKEDGPGDDFDEKLDDSLRLCFPFEFNTNTGNSMIDLYQLLSTRHMLKIEELKSIRDRIDLLDNNNVFKYVGKKTFNQNGAYYPTQTTSSGLCIYFPRNYNSINSLIHRFYTAANYSSEFDSTINWRSFIKTYLQKRGIDSGG
ncbi:MAG: hypothetical protein IPO42_15200 [Chitinophagaceae bacterium]|nr:hypothetical protein [Chitinophagaceae bacterium]